MSRVLILCGSYPADLASGADLRYQNLCKQLARRNDTYLVCLGPIPDEINPESHIGVQGFATLPVVPATGKSFLRHLRVTNIHLLKRSLPAYLAATQANLAKLIAEWKIDILVCMVPAVAELMLPIELPKLLDYCDSGTLTYRRLLKNRSHRMSIRERLGIYMNYFRRRNSERALVRHFDRTTTISNADRECLLEVSGVQPEKVLVIPNGVSSSALDLDLTNAGRKRSVVFWGNLDFPPNWTAVDYFNREIFLPHLADKDVEWHIIGNGADDSIRRLAEHSQVSLHGFVEDLYAEVASHGAMINPMVEGSGLKNKVLEAFACRLPVVSTTMGIEAVGATAGDHYIAADDPASFSAGIIRCLEDAELAAKMSGAARQFVEDHFEWNAIGEKFDAIVTEVSQ